jgi:hypothetical protein
VATTNLITQSVRIGSVKKFVFTSSIAVYGSGRTPMTEDMEPLPEDPYGISKLACEYDLKAANEIVGLPFVIFRPHNVYGPGQNMYDKYRNVVGIFLNQLQAGNKLTIFGDGHQTQKLSIYYQPDGDSKIFQQHFYTCHTYFDQVHRHYAVGILQMANQRFHWQLSNRIRMPILKCHMDLRGVVPCLRS